MLWAGFLFELLGSFHCVGMCGAIALALPGQMNAAKPDWHYLGGRLLYNLGRITTYTVLGAGAGLAGQTLRLAGWQQSLSIVSGLLILLLLVPERHTSRAAADAVSVRPVADRTTPLNELLEQRSCT